MIPPRTSVPTEEFLEEEIPKTALISSLLCPQVLRNCLTEVLRLHNLLYIQLDTGGLFQIKNKFLSLLHLISDKAEL